VATIPPHTGAPPHIHHQETEAFFLLEGELDFIAGERRVSATSGDFLHVDKGVMHGYTNPGPAIARYLGLVTPGGLHEQLFAAIGEEATAETLPPPPARPPDIARLIELASRYHTEIVPPPTQ
jgi:gentisate 1,2-dioxygenase